MSRAPDIALVTGAGGGLGRAIVGALVDRGAYVVATDLDATAVDGLGSEAKSLDVVERADVEALVAEVVERHERIDVVVNLAGVIRNQIVHKIDDADFQLVMATHLGGSLNTMRAALPHMRARRYGRIVNMSSLAARGSVAGAAYGAAKGAIEGLTRSAAVESAKHNITVNCVAPGLVAAGMFLTVPQAYQDEQAAAIPMGRPADPEEVAACVAFFASPEASYVTGQTLFVCGGLSLGF